MRKLLLFLVCLSSVGCGSGFENKSNRDPRSISGVDPAFTSYVSMFESLWGRSIGDIPIQFTNLEGNVIGTCTRWSSGHRQIVIDRDYWNNPYTEEREKIGLIFHELGHCALNRDHVNSLYYYSGTHIAGQVPYSIMYPYNFYSNSYAELESYYFNELFNPTNTYSTEQTLASKDGCVHDIDNGHEPNQDDDINREGEEL